MLILIAFKEKQKKKTTTIITKKYRFLKISLRKKNSFTETAKKTDLGNIQPNSFSNIIKFKCNWPFEMAGKTVLTRIVFRTIRAFYCANIRLQYWFFVCSRIHWWTTALSIQAIVFITATQSQTIVYERRKKRAWKLFGMHRNKNLFHLNLCCSRFSLMTCDDTHYAGAVCQRVKKSTLL